MNGSDKGRDAADRKGISVAGRLTVSAAESLREELEVRIESGGPVHIEFPARDEIDIAGIQVLIAAQAYAASLNGCEFVIDDPSPELRIQFEGAGVTVENGKVRSKNV
jgi:anti-anti-sigma regulatory factor